MSLRLLHNESHYVDLCYRRVSQRYLQLSLQKTVSENSEQIFIMIFQERVSKPHIMPEECVSPIFHLVDAPLSHLNKCLTLCSSCQIPYWRIEETTNSYVLSLQYFKPSILQPSDNLIYPFNQDTFIHNFELVTPKPPWTLDLVTISHLAMWYLKLCSAPCQRNLALIISIFWCAPSSFNI